MHTKSSPPSLAVLAALAAAVSACAVTQETKPVEVALDGDVARSQASALSAAVAAAQADDGVAVAEALGAVGDAAAALAPPAKDGARERVRRLSTTCACPKGARSCVLDGCTIGTARVRGALSWSGGRVACEGLTFDVAATSTSVGAAHVAVDCAFTYAEGSLDGSLRTTGDAVVDGVTYAWDATLAARDVTFTSRAFTGGSVDVTASVTMSSAADGERRFSASGVVRLP